MRVCGVELTGSDAVVCLLIKDQGLFSLPDLKLRKLTLTKNHTREELLQFQAAFVQFLTEYAVDKVVIRERMTKGRFAGGALSFKMEAAIQLISQADIEITLLSPTLIKSTLAENPLPIPFEATGLKAFQEGAFTAAYTRHIIN